MCAVFRLLALSLAHRPAPHRIIVRVSLNRERRRRWWRRHSGTCVCVCVSNSVFLDIILLLASLQKCLIAFPAAFNASSPFSFSLCFSSRSRTSPYAIRQPIASIDTSKKRIAPPSLLFDCTYALRSRRSHSPNSSSPIVIDYAATLPPNTAALLGVCVSSSPISLLFYGDGICVS